MDNLKVLNSYSPNVGVNGMPNKRKIIHDNTTKTLWFEKPPLYKFVDLGLPSGTLWAERNVGASSPEDYGFYFAWGETKGFSKEECDDDVRRFTWGEYKFTSGACTSITDTNFRGGFTKYNNNSSHGIVDNLTTLELVDDAAYRTDKICKMPTYADVEELIKNSTYTLETLNGMNIAKITSNINNKYIYIPFNGYYDNGDVRMVNAVSTIWTSSVIERNNRFFVSCN